METPVAEKENVEAVNEFMNQIDSPVEDIVGEEPIIDEEAGGEPVNEDIEDKGQAASEEEHQEPGDVPVGVVKDLRQKGREKDDVIAQVQRQNAELEGRLTQLTQMVVQQRGTEAPGKPDIGEPESEKSPLQKFAEEYPDMAPDAEVLLEEQDWHKQQEVQRTETAENNRLSSEREDSKAVARDQYSAEKVGVGLDIDSVVTLARQAGKLTPADYAYASSKGANSAQTLYRLAIQNIRDGGGQGLTELNKRIATRKTAPKPRVNNNNTPPGGGPELSDDDGDYSDITNSLFR